MIKLIIRNLRLLSRTRKEPYLLFYKMLGFYPFKIEYYQLAVRHRSVSVVAEDGKILSNERLEFLGDAVLNSVVTDILYRRFENQREGFLTNTRSKIVKRDSLNQLAVAIGLDKIMMATKQVSMQTNKNVYGNALEALLGAIYLDYGYKRCKKFIEKKLIDPYVNIKSVAEEEVNFKSKVIEWSQKKKVHVEFELFNQQLHGSNQHIFYTRLLIEGQSICESEGRSKKDSQQKAAAIAYHLIQNDPRFLYRIQSNVGKDSNDDSIL